MTLQVGGNHYEGDYQHWDWAIDVKLGSLETAATKYVSRWYQKNGIQDLEKTVSYLVKMRPTYVEGRYANTCNHVAWNDDDPEVHRQAGYYFNKFVVSSNIKPIEADLCWQIANWKNNSDLNNIIRQLKDHIKLAGQRCAVVGVYQPLTPLEQSQTQQSQPNSSNINHPAPFGYADGS